MRARAKRWALLALLVGTGGCHGAFVLDDLTDGGQFRADLVCPAVLDTVCQGNLTNIVGNVVASTLGPPVHIGDLIEVDAPPGPLGGGLAGVMPSGMSVTCGFFMPAFAWGDSTVVVIPMLPVDQLGGALSNIILSVTNATGAVLVKLNVEANAAVGSPGTQTAAFATAAQALSTVLTAPAGAANLSLFSMELAHLGPMVQDVDGLTQSTDAAPLQVGATLSVGGAGLSLMDQLLTGLLEPPVTTGTDAGPGEAAALTAEALAEQALPLAVALVSTAGTAMQANSFPGADNVIAASAALLPLGAEVNNAVQLAAAGNDQQLQQQQTAWTDLTNTISFETVAALDAGALSLQGSFQADDEIALQDVLASVPLLEVAPDGGCVVNGCAPGACGDAAGISFCQISPGSCDPATGLCTYQSARCPVLCVVGDGDAGCSCE